MSNISTHFKLTQKQSQLDFVDVKLNDDNKLFIDPRLIESNPDAAIRPMADHLYTFFGHLVLSVSSSQQSHYLLSGVQEPTETRLGYGNHNPNGKSAGPRIKVDLVSGIKDSPLMQQRKIQNLSDLSLFVPNMGCDRVSDITTKVIKEHLIAFTQQQCVKLGIPMKPVFQKDMFDKGTVKWVHNTVELPVYRTAGVEKPIIFVPKWIVNREQSISSNLNSFFRFARNYIIDKNDGSFLSGVPRNGKQNTILRKDFDKTIENPKEEMTKWVLKHPNILNDYWDKNVENVKPLTDSEIEEIVYG